ncbi:hypothetical protein EDD15DRAFT_2364317 [Pisolithus albus]|nr:hypothetical protein EDD15DRAFT_2364317 [Pisolithus albus]
MDAIETDIGKLPMSAIIAQVGGMMKLSNEERTKKTLLLNCVLRDSPHALLLSLQRAGLAHEQMKLDRRGRKRPRAHEVDIGRKAACTEEYQELVTVGDQSSDPADTFLHVPTADEVEQIYEAFYLATGTHALQSDTCGVCARECSVQEDGLQSIKLTDIPNPARLRPKKPHPNHGLVNGMLLEPAAITQEGAEARVNIC